jgi:hypothetical protein
MTYSNANPVNGDAFLDQMQADARQADLDHQQNYARLVVQMIGGEPLSERDQRQLRAAIDHMGVAPADVLAEVRQGKAGLPPVAVTHLLPTDHWVADRYEQATRDLAREAEQMVMVTPAGRYENGVYLSGQREPAPALAPAVVAERKKSLAAYRDAAWARIAKHKGKPGVMTIDTAMDYSHTSINPRRMEFKQLSGQPDGEFESLRSHLLDGVARREASRV